jgi:hypothetical protein
MAKPINQLLVEAAQRSHRIWDDPIGPRIETQETAGTDHYTIENVVTRRETAEASASMEPPKASAVPQARRDPK